jgi:HK97 family phage portal protein
VGFMKMLDRALGTPTKEVEMTPSRLLRGERPQYNDGRVTIPTGLRDIFNAFKEDPAVFTAIERIGASIADIPFVMIEADQAKEDRKFASARHFHAASRSKTYAGVMEKWASIEGGRVIRQDPILDILANPCPSAGVSGNLMKRAIVAYMELTGMAYVEKLYDPKDEKKVTGLWPLISPLKMQVVAGATRLIDGYVWTGSTGAVAFKPEDMIYFRSFNPESPFYGYSPTQVLRVIIASNLKSINWNYSYFKNSARPDGILSSEQYLNDSDVETILNTWLDSHQDEDNWFLPAVMGKGMSYKPTSGTHKDMDWALLRRHLNETIFGAYGVPPIVAGDYKDANRASSDVMYKLYMEGAILPRCDVLEDVINMALLPQGSGLRIVFDLGSIEALKGDLLNLAKVGARVRTQGWSANEMRSLIWNLPIAEGNDCNAIYNPKGDEVIGYAPLPSELVEGY